MHILVVDDDVVFATVLARAFARRGHAATLAHDASAALAAVTAAPPTHAVLDLKLGHDSGLALLAALRERAPALRVVMLTGYPSVPTTVQSIKAGAVDYLVKPVDAVTVLAALAGVTPAAAEAAPLPDEAPLSRIEWEHIQRVLADHGGNVSSASKALGMHRRSLQRKLAKRPTR